MHCRFSFRQNPVQYGTFYNRFLYIYDQSIKFTQSEFVPINVKTYIDHFISDI